MARFWVVAAFVVVACGLLGCADKGAPEARKKIRTAHAARVASILREDIDRHATGLQRAADRIAAGFVKVQGEQQEREVRQVLKLLRSPKKGIQELVISPLSFIAAVNKDGVVVARDAEPDAMKGMNLGKLFPSVQKALAGSATIEINQFESLNKGGKPSVTILMAAPAHYDGQVVGALVLGIPLWRLQQRLSKQLQMEEAGKKARHGDLGLHLPRRRAVPSRNAARSRSARAGRKDAQGGSRQEPGRLHRRGAAVRLLVRLRGQTAAAARARRRRNRVPDGSAVSGHLGTCRVFAFA